MFSTNTLPEGLALSIRSQAAALAADPSFLPTMAGAFRVGPEHTPSESDLALFHQWLRDEVATIPARLAWVNRPVPLSEAVHALTRPILPGEFRVLPVSVVGNDPVPGLMTERQNVAFRAVHDAMHAKLGVDDSWFGELATTLGHLHTAPPQIWPILASEVAGQAAVAIFEGDFPEQRLSGLCLRMLALHESNPLCL
jgi:hypothetical protein